MPATTQNTSPYAYQEPYRAAIADAFDAHLNKAEDRHSGVFWFGAPGPGKTFVAGQFADYVAQLNIGKVWRGAALEIVAETQAAIGRNSDARDLFTMVQEVKRAKLVLLDDLGRERGEYGQSTMFTLLNAALNGGAFLIATANRDAKSLATYYGDDAGLRSRLSSLLQQEWPADLPNARKPGFAALAASKAGGKA